MNYREFYLTLCDKLKRDATVCTATVLSQDGMGQKQFCTGNDYREQENIYCETLQGRPTVVICGGGHVSLALAPIVKSLDCNLIVIDSREEFANEKRFYMADEVYEMDFEEAFDKIGFPDQAYYVIVTRGHQYDYQCLTSALALNYSYIGMIGSRSKVAMSRERLEKEGYSKEVIDSIHAPIGIKLGGQTPAEIAVSIAAELVQVKNKVRHIILEDEVLEGIRFPERSVMATVVRKSGSSPRGAGTRMIITESGRQFGTIGGGAVEFAVLQKCRDLRGTPGFAVESYDLSNSEAAVLGMVCGGKVTVMFETLL